MSKNEALKMAIEAMTLPNNLSFLMAITACKDALEQEERTQRTMHCGTADAFIAMDDDHKRRWFVQSLRESKRRKELEDILEQPAQEPSCWITAHGEGFRIRFEKPDNDVTLGWTPLYTHPAPSWQGLSDGEISKVISDEQIPVRTGKTANRFARAIEQASRNKNGY